MTWITTALAMVEPSLGVGVFPTYVCRSAGAQHLRRAARTCHHPRHHADHWNRADDCTGDAGLCALSPRLLQRFNTCEKSGQTRAPKEEGVVEKGQAMTFGPGASKSRLLLPQLLPDLFSYPDRAARDRLELALHLGPCDQRELRGQFDLGASRFDRQPLNQSCMLR